MNPPDPGPGLSSAPGVWLQIGLSSDFPRGGAVQRVTRWGEELVAYRARSGRLVVHRAVCPHLGAHLGGGTVRGECLECPFHGWQFHPDGGVQYVPGARRLPARAHLDTFATHEVGGVAFVFPREVRDAVAPPAFPAAITAELQRPGFRSSFSRTQVHANLGEVQENAADSAHLQIVHRPMITGATPFRSIIDDAGAFVTQGVMNLRVGGEVEMRVRCIDPCSTITSSTSRYYGSDVLSFGAQITEKHIDLIFVIRTAKNAPVIGYAIHAMTRHKLATSLDEDRPVWSEKVWLEQPIVSDADGPISAYRRWLAAFEAGSNASGPGAPERVAAHRDTAAPLRERR